ncbi:MAG: GIY-YIG nuclease family protein, partial [Candidatus Poseidoniales archaeon]
MVNIYVLELQDNKFYVGKTDHTFQRFNQHKTGSGAKWTQKHNVKDLFAFHKDMKDSDENKITIQMMKKYGVRNVRGGSWTKVNMTEAEIKRLENKINARGRSRGTTKPSQKKASASKKKLCTRCGRTSHTVEKCYARFHANGKSLTRKSEISDAEYRAFFNHYRQQRKIVAAEDPQLNETDVEKEVQQLEQMKESKPEEVIQVMASFSEEDESNFSFLELLSGSSYSLIDVIDETIATSIQNVADAVEKKAKTAAKKVNKSAKKLLKGMKKKL